MNLISKQNSMTLHELLQLGKKELAILGEHQAGVDSEHLLGFLLSLKRSDLYLHPWDEVSSAQQQWFFEQIEKRKQRIPLTYLLGEVDFWKERLAVSSACLVPRPETEILIETITRQIPFDLNMPLHFIDIGTGSGAIAISLLRHYPNAVATLVDLSKEALAVAAKNVNRYQLEARARLIHSDLFQVFSGDENSKWDLIVSNPPYLSENDFNALEPELCHEPRLALDGGKDGLDFYRKIFKQAPKYLKQNGWLAVEMGQGQAEMLTALLFETKSFEEPVVVKDYLNIERVVIAKKKHLEG